jgi:hypothetical protein
MNKIFKNKTELPYFPVIKSSDITKTEISDNFEP